MRNLFGKIARVVDQKIKKCWLGVCKGTIVPRTVLVHDLLAIDLLAILQKNLDRALFSYIFIREVRSSGVRAAITIVRIRQFYKM